MANIEEKKPTPFSVVLHSEAYKNLINNTLGDPEVARKFVADISAVVANNPRIRECEPSTIITAGLTAASLNLPLAGNLGFAYIVPYKDKRSGTMKAQFQVGWKGLVQLSQRSSVFKSLGSRPVHKSEYKGLNKFGEDEFEFSHEYDNEEIVGYMAYFVLTNGFEKTYFMTKEQCIKHANKYSQSFKFDKDKSTLWNTEFDTMAIKTVLKLLLSKFAPLSTEMQTAIKADQAVVNEDGTYEYVDNVKTTKTNVFNSIKEVPVEEPVEAETVVDVDTDENSPF